MPLSEGTKEAIREMVMADPELQQKLQSAELPEDRASILFAAAKQNNLALEHEASAEALTDEQLGALAGAGLLGDVLSLPLHVMLVPEDVKEQTREIMQIITLGR